MSAYTGVGFSQFMVPDDPSEVPSVLELNLRLTGSTAVATHCGLHLSWSRRDPLPTLTVMGHLALLRP